MERGIAGPAPGLHAGTLGILSFLALSPAAHALDHRTAAEKTSITDITDIPETSGKSAREIRLVARFSRPRNAALARFAVSDSSAEASLPEQEELTRLTRRFRCRSSERLAPWDPSEGTVVLRFPGGASAGELIEAYRATGLFDFVEEDGVGRAHGDRARASDAESMLPSGESAPQPAAAAPTPRAASARTTGAALAAASPDDPFYDWQYGLRNDGTRTFGRIRSKAGADIEAEAAWDLHPGDPGLIVAILDGGIASSHPEFAGRLWTNPGEIPGNGVDDDGDGLIDDVHGWSFATTRQGGEADISDRYGHGTNVAGIVGALAGNGLGVAGAARCTLMPVKVLDDSLKGYYSWWAAGLRFAVDHGARVVNLSLGGVDPASTALRSAVEYALARNVTVVASMGNDRDEVPQYPAALPGVIAVGATGPDDDWADSFPWDTTKGSDFGSHISVSAPGNYIYGLDYANPSNYQSYWSGTSQAAPFVSAVCALLLSQDPQRDAADVKRLIEAGAEDGVGDPALDLPGWDKYFGHGRLNAYRSLLAGSAVAILPVPRISRSPASPLPRAFDLLGRLRTPVSPAAQRLRLGR